MTDVRGRPAPPAAGTKLVMPRRIKVIALVAFIVALGFGVVGPAIPLLAEQFGVGKATAATAISAFAFFRLASAFANGKLVERVGEQKVLAAGLAMQAVTTVLAGASTNFGMVVLFRSIGGFGSAAFTVAAMSLLLKLAPETHRGRAASIYQGGFLLGAIAGPAFGGFLTEISPRVPFFVYGGFLAVAGAVGVVMLREPRSDPPGPVPASDPLLAEHTDEGLVALAGIEGAVDAEVGDERADRPTPGVLGMREALRSRAYLACLVVNLGVGWMLYGVRNSLLPVYVVDELHHSPVWAGTAFLISSSAQGLVLLGAGRLVDAWGRRPPLLIGGVICTSSVVALALPPDTVLFLAAMVAFGGAGALLASAPAAVLADVTGGRGGRAVAVFQMSADLGGVLGPLVAGALTDAYSYQIAFAAGAAVLGAGLFGSLLMPETRRSVAAATR